MRCWSVVRPLDVQQTKRSVGAMSRVLVATAEAEEAALLAELSELDKHKSSAADVDPEPQPQPEPEPELELEPELMQKLRQDWEPEAKPEPEAEPEPEPEQVQAAPTISAAKAEAEAEAEAEVSPLLDDPNLSEGFLGPSSIEEQGGSITVSAKLPVAAAQAPASEPLLLGSVDRRQQQQLPALTLSSRQALLPAVRLELGSPSPTPPSPRPAPTILLPAVSMDLGPQ